MASVASFYSLQARNRVQSGLLVVAIVGLLMLLGTLIGIAWTGSLDAALPVTAFSGLAGFGSAAGSYLWGDAAVLAAAGARPADPVKHAQLINVVQELSLSAGIPAPRVYTIPDSALNAFATGRDPQHASLAITEGLLDRLDREELQGVIGHELSHVRNLDIRYALLVAAMVGAIALLADLFLRNLDHIADSDSDSDSDSGAWRIAIIALAVAVALLAPFFARLIQMAASRQREYLADASSVELTRNPVGLENALLKVGADREVLEVANRATQHLYFANPIHRFEDRAKGLFSTHPPIVDRVNRIRTLRGAPPLDEAVAAAYVE
jgi:heat shock protein HtpX